MRKGFDLSRPRCERNSCLSCPQHPYNSKWRSLPGSPQQHRVAVILKEMPLPGRKRAHIYHSVRGNPHPV
jgi:hypothetical protein